jgi:Lon protease-like protein
MGAGFDPRDAELPATLPIFPLTGVLLLPRGKLPLNIFEPRYLAMVSDALAGNRMIGMVQPLEDDPSTLTGAVPPGAVADRQQPAVYPTGCAGRISAFSEAAAGRFHITLTGVARFTIREEIASLHGYRRVTPDWQGYQRDLAVADEAIVDRPRLLAALKAYFVLHGVTADWDSISATADEPLVTSLAMICNFAPNEKQALLEAPDLAERSRVMTALVEMAVLARSGAGEAARH